MVKITSVCVFLIIWPASQTQLYNSLSVMEVLLETQEKIIEHMEKYEWYITDNKKRHIVQKFLSRCRKEHQIAVWDGAHYLGNPINAYTLIMRLSRDLNYVEKILNETTIVLKYQSLNTLVYPAEEDVVGVVEGMSRLQLLYDLDVTKLANGTLSSIYAHKNPGFTEYATAMISCDCYELGLVEYEKTDRSRNIAWMKETLRKYNYDAECPVNRVDIYDRLSVDYNYMGETAKSIYWLEMRIDATPGDPQNEKYKKAIFTMNSLKNEEKPYKEPKNMDPDFYPNTCLKTYFNPNASLTCYYAHGPHQFLLLAPLKTEHLHLSPDVVMFYDVITDDEIHAIRTLARPKFHQAKATTESGVANFDYCVHQVAWLPDHLSAATERVARRIAQFTGLVVNANTTEEFQVANYGTGGFYGPHCDFIRPNASSIETGKRFATALFYIADVDVGGATVFTKLGMSAFPVKNAAIFWWNLDPAGNNDHNTEHAVCPVLRGSRWVVSKWISLSGQELIRPCPASYYNQNKPNCEVKRVTN